MPDAPGLRDAPEAIHNVVGGASGRLVDNDNAIHDYSVATGTRTNRETITQFACS